MLRLWPCTVWRRLLPLTGREGCQLTNAGGGAGYVATTEPYSPDTTDVYFFIARHQYFFFCLYSMRVFAVLHSSLREKLS